MPLSQIVSDSIEDGAVAPLELSSVAQYTGFKNKIINGSFQVWQRGTTYALTGSFAYGSADRWACAMAATAAGIANQVASGLTGFQYALKLGRNSGSTSTGTIYVNQVVENANTYDLQGQTVTVSFWAKAGANYSSAGSAFGLSVNTGAGSVDSSSLSATFGSWTGNANPYAGNTTITTTWTRYSITCTLGSTITNIGLLFFFTPSGTAGADDNVYITGVQLEKGVTATSFDYRPYGTELALCQRYYWRNTAVGIFTQFGFSTSRGSANSEFFVQFPVTMRAAPTSFDYASLLLGLFAGGATSAVSTATLSTANTSLSSSTISIVAAGSIGAAGQALQVIANNSSTAYIGFNAEL